MKLKQFKLSKCTHDAGVRIHLAAADADIVLRLPNGEEITLQWRTEGPSLDVLLPTPMHVYNWKGVDMTPAKAVSKKQPEARIADQLCIPLSEQHLEEQ